MGSIRLPGDFKEFLKLLNSKKADFLLVGGYAVAYHGYPRATADMDLWIAANPSNAQAVAEALIAFGFSPATISAQNFVRENQVFRMGIPPWRIELLTSVSGVTFEECRARRTVDVVDGVEVPIISLADLKANKKAAGRLKDLSDLENLP
jgi:hypothetical protein